MLVSPLTTLGSILSIPITPRALSGI